GIAAWHGPHQVAETSTMTTFLAKSESFTSLPRPSSTVNSGATSPFCSRGDFAGGLAAGTGSWAGAAVNGRRNGRQDSARRVVMGSGRERGVVAAGGVRHPQAAANRVIWRRRSP